MINSIQGAIAKALTKEFGDGYKVYPENVKQGLVEPCFFVQCINREHVLFLGTYDGKRRYQDRNEFCITYLPENKQRAREEIHDVAFEMEACLEWLTVGDGLIRGEGMHYDISDDVLSFYVNYDGFALLEVETEDMAELDHTTKVRA